MYRLTNSLREKEMSISLDKVVPLYYDLTQVCFGLESPSLYTTIKSSATSIIHCAWTVNFAAPLTSFETQLAGLHNLLSFTMQTSRHARFLFCSSIGVAQSIKGPVTVAPAPIPSLSDCSPMGYAQSKLVGERIVEAAANIHGANVTILRIGQIIPGRRRGTKLWNPTEAIPLMIKASSKSSAGALPILDVGRDSCSWIEADTLAEAILEIAGIGHVPMDSAFWGQQELVYNLVNPHEFSWKNEFLPALQRAGLDFDIVPWQEWLRRLELSTEDANLNPSRKLLGFWSKQASREGEIRFEPAANEAQKVALSSMGRVIDGDLIEQIIIAWRNFYLL